MATRKPIYLDSEGFPTEFSPASDSLEIQALTVNGTSGITLVSGTVTGLPTPTGNTDAASKSYVDSVAQGLDVHDSVKAATTAAGTLTSDFENGDVIDGVTLATGDRILIKDQAAGTENGIYIVEATGAPTRASDWQVGYAAAGAFVFVEQGTANDNSGFVCTNSGTADVTGTDALAFSQFSGAGQIVAGNGVSKSGNELSVDPDSETGGNIQPVNVTANGVGLDVGAVVGTGLSADGSANLRVGTQGNGIAGGDGTTLSVDPDATTGGNVVPVNVVANGVGLDVSTIVDDSTVEADGSGNIRVKADGIDGSHLAPNIEISTTGNITTTAGVFTGDGSGLTNLPSAGSTDAVTITALKSTAGTIAKGQVVHLVGYSGSNYTVELADADDSALMPAIGVAGATLTNTASGTVVIQGRVLTLNTASWSAGDSLYVSTTAGTLTNSKPTGDTSLIQRVGEVAFSDASNGVILVTGAGHTNALPQIAQDKIWIGDSSGVPQATTVGDGLTATAGSNFSVELSALPGLELTGTSPDKTLQAKVDGVTMTINGSGALQALGADEAKVVENEYTTDGVGVTKGDPVYFSSNGIVSGASASDATANQVVGIAKTTVGASATVEVISDGRLDGCLVGATAGDQVYLAAGGGLTTTKPTGGGHRITLVGFAINANDLHIEINFLGRLN